MASSILIVGAGSVGQVFGRHLQLGGAAVTFLVRPAHRDVVARGFELYPLREWRHGPPVHWADFELVHSVDALRSRQFDQVWLTVSSAGLQGPWLRELIAAIGDATVVAFQPGLADRERILASGVPPDRLVWGMIAFLSYPAPMPGETRFEIPGTAYWLPPGTAIPFSGEQARTRAVVEPLARGGLRATMHREVPRETAFATAVITPLTVALEQAGWSLKGLAASPLMGVAARAIGEAQRVVSRVFGASPPLTTRLATFAPLLRLGARVAPKLFPLPLEAYLQRHFTKLGAQTPLLLGPLIEEGERAGLPVVALRQLAGRLA